MPDFPGGWPRPPAVGHASVGGAERGGAIRLVPGHPRLGGDGDMESGAYGAANAGGSFDLRRYVSQPQVVTRLVSMVSRPERTRSHASPVQGPWAAGRGAQQVATAARPGPGGERGAPRPSASLSPPASASCSLLNCVAPDLVSPTRVRAPPHSRPLVRAALVRDVPRCSGEAGLSPCWQWEGPERGTPQQVARTPRLPALGIHLEGTF